MDVKYAEAFGFLERLGDLVRDFGLQVELFFGEGLEPEGADAYGDSRRHRGGKLQR